MGIPGILKEIGKGERTALSKLAIEFLERNNRPLRIAVDAAIWNFQTQSGQGGKNPALRTLFFRLLKLLALPIQPVFVYDGKNKPLTKRGRTVRHYNGTCVPNELSKVLVRKFCYPWHVAPGEAEAECALLQKRGIVDMVMSQDADAIMFGAGITLRDWSKEGIRGNKGPTHVNVMDSLRLKEISGLDSNGMILVALLSGGDYDEAGVPGFGAALACEVARAGFGTDLIDLVLQEDVRGLKEWRERLQYELETNESGYFKRRHKTLSVPENFPDQRILGYYLKPAVSSDNELLTYEAEWVKIWNSEIDVAALREYTASMLDWQWKSGARRFTRCSAQPLFQDRLRRGTIETGAFTLNSISERRKHFVNDGIPELRLSAVPADVVGIDIEAEEDNPEYVAEQAEEEDEELPAFAEEAQPTEGTMDRALVPASPSKRQKAPPWSPYVLEKWWIPETLMQLGLPEIVEDWHQLQRDLQAEPKRPVARKPTKPVKGAKSIDNHMKAGALRGYFTKASKSVNHLQSSSVVGLGHGKSDTTPRLNREASSKTLGQATDASGMMLPELILSDDHIVEQTALTQPNQQNHVLLRAREDENIQNHQIRVNANNSSQEILSLPTDSERLVAAEHSLSQNTTNHSKTQANVATSFDVRSSSPDMSFDRKQQQGISFSSAIVINSSPILSSPSEPLISQENMKRVTQRKVRRTDSSPRKLASSSQASPTREQRPIESFFIHAQQGLNSDDTVTQSLPSTSFDTAQSQLQPLKRAARDKKAGPLARDSLPGTWKDIGVDSVSSKKASRVSFIDLTND